MNPALDLVDDGFAALALTVLAQTTILVLGALVALRLFRVSSAAARHALWCAVLAGLVLSPVIAWTVDHTGIAVLELTVAGPVAAVPEPAPATAAVPPWRPREGLPGSDWKAAWPWVGLVWLGGVVLGALQLLRGVVKTRRVIGRAAPIDDPRIHRIAAEVGTRLGLRVPPRLSRSRAVTSPVAIGVLRPTVLLPATLELGEVGLAHVLTHELAHVARRDLAVALVQRLVAVALWPQPLIRVVNAHLDRAREELCDNHVLESTTATSYSRTLLSIAEGGLRPAAALGLTHATWSLEDRISGLLDERRSGATRGCRWLALPAVAVLGTVAAVVAATSLVAAQPAAAATDGRRAQLHFDYGGDRFTLHLTAAGYTVDLNGEAGPAHRVERDGDAALFFDRGQRVCGFVVVSTRKLGGRVGTTGSVAATWGLELDSMGPAGDGVRIGTLASDSPLARAGAAVGDRIARVGDQPVRSRARLVAAVAAARTQLALTLRTTAGDRPISIEPRPRRSKR